ncbi:ATP synthase subunit delta [Paenibacillus montaniterrae]|uniref:ATP synthase subunit delta n=1 Tax=Paenibacillus montaniterrae TaxID=429341 RepID=A0A919YV34_9BACL|nr:F0F1 ATP synthase subunit delta [Paenibacillus montaniterrae]GIP19051.1 ATP synthase subunit delta [Paenibacillus montaniterrae]
MSRDIVVAKRYAQALFELAAAGKVVSQVELELKLVVDALAHNEQLNKFLELPSVQPQNKIDLLKQSFGDQLSELVYNTLQLMIERGRQSLISNLFESYVKIAGDALGQAKATVYTARSLSDAELANVAAQFEQVTGKKIIAEQIVNPELLGGVQVRIGDRLYDGSLAGKLERLQKTLYSKAL